MPKKQSQELTKERRLLKRFEFSLVLKHGRRIDSKNLFIVVRNTQLGFSRLGISVSKGVGNSVFRNKLKRQIREAFRRESNLRDQSVDIIFIVRGKKQGFNGSCIEDEIRRLFERI